MPEEKIIFIVLKIFNKKLDVKKKLKKKEIEV